ncbi:MAG: DUF2059 domain-containing protein [Betaproteobacteria bacterium]|nr:MAG: DUF2059 domain-containing protein [Betaproteobacteria bacterium]
MKLFSRASLVALLAAGSLFSSSFVSAQTGELSAEKRAGIKTLLEATGVRAIPDQIAFNSVQSMAGGIKQLDAKFPNKGFDVMRDAIAAGLAAKVDVPGGLIEQVTLVYHNAFTAAEVADLVKFYQSPVGKKLLANQGKLNNETFQTAMKWADSLGADLDQRMDAALKKENIKLPDPPKAPAAAAPNKAGSAAPPAKKQ